MEVVMQKPFQGIKRALFLALISLCLCQCVVGCDRKEQVSVATTFGVARGKDTQVAWVLRSITRDGDKEPYEVITVVIVKGEARIMSTGTDSTNVVFPDGTELDLPVDSGKQYWVYQANRVKEIERPLSVEAVRALADLDGSGQEGLLDQFTDLEQLRSFLLRRSAESHNTQTEAEK